MSANPVPGTSAAHEAIHQVMTSPDLSSLIASGCGEMITLCAARRDPSACQPGALWQKFFPNVTVPEGTVSLMPFIAMCFNLPHLERALHFDLRQLPGFVFPFKSATERYVITLGMMYPYEAMVGASIREENLVSSVTHPETWFRSGSAALWLCVFQNKQGMLNFVSRTNIAPILNISADQLIPDGPKLTLHACMITTSQLANEIWKKKATVPPPQFKKPLTHWSVPRTLTNAATHIRDTAKRESVRSAISMVPNEARAVWGAVERNLGAMRTKKRIQRQRGRDPY